MAENRQHIRQTDPRILEGDLVQSAGIYALPIVGEPLQKVRTFFDDMAPEETDAPGVKAGKQVLRYGAVAAAGVAAASAAAIVVL